MCLRTLKMKTRQQFGELLGQATTLIRELDDQSQKIWSRKEWMDQEFRLLLSKGPRFSDGQLLDCWGQEQHED